MKILGIDDEQLNLDILEMYLDEVMENHFFTGMNDFPDELNESYDIYFLDLCIDGKGPEEFLEKHSIPRKKIIFISGNFEELLKWQEKGFRTLNKPISLEILQTEMKSFI